MPRLQFPGDRERDVLLVGAAPADRAGILAAVTGIDRDRHAPRDCAAVAARGLLARRQRLRRRLRRGRGILRALAFEQRHQRVQRYLRIEVEHEPVAVFRDGLQREQVGLHLGLQVEHDAHHVRRLAAQPDRRDVRVRRLHARRQFRELARRVDAVDVEHEAIGLRSTLNWCGSGVFDSTITRVYSCAGHTRAEATREAACAHAAGTASCAAGSTIHWHSRRRCQLMPISARAGRRGPRSRPRIAYLPRSSPTARGRDRSRPAPRARASRSRSAAGNRPPTRSGHSTRHTLSFRKQVGEPRRFPFARIGEPIKIKVIQV